MPEERETLEQSPAEQKLADAQQKKQRNDANNANAVSAALEATKNKHPYLAAAAAADRLTGGRLSKAAGKILTNVNKFSPGGRITQAALNKAGESGTTDRIGQALSKKKTNGNVGGKSTATVKDKDSGFFSKKEVQEQTSDGGGVSFKATVKFMKIGLIAFAPVMAIVVFMNLLVAGSQTYLQVIGLGQADKVSSDTAEESIEKHASEDVLNEDTDFDDNPTGEIGYIYDDVFIEDSISKQKFSRMNFVARKFNEADLNELKDYYSEISSYENGNYDMDTVYNFFFKLLYIQKHYLNSYGIDLDMALIMSVLKARSADMSEVFVSNTKGYRVNSILTGKKENNRFFKYNYDWSKQKLSKKDSSHDIEILAQAMVKKTSDSGCSNTVDGACYELVSQDQYKEFLRGFLEKKYFLNIDNVVDNSNNNDSNVNSDSLNPAVGNFRGWTQCGQSWSDKIVPKSTETMCQIGCAITSVTIQMARSGALTLEDSIDPGVALKYYKFARGGNFYWNSTTNLAPNFKHYTKLNLVGMSKANIAKKLSSYDENKYYMVLAVSKQGVNYIHHYVALDYIDTKTNKIYIMDPASTKQTDLYKYYKLYNAHIYIKEV